MHDLLRVGLGQRAAEDREILREDVDRPSVDQAVAGDEAVAIDDLLVHAEIAAAVAHQLVELFEGAFVEQQVDALARGEFAFGVLPLRRSSPPPASALACRLRSSLSLFT